jgi:hypothetical protein
MEVVQVDVTPLVARGVLAPGQKAGAKGAASRFKPAPKKG